MLEIRVLGPVRILESGETIIAGPKERALVASMAIAPGLTESHDVIARQLWPDRKLPAPARIRGVYLQLREQIPENTLERNGGRRCTLLVDAQEVDLLRFRELVDYAQTLDGPARLPMLRAGLEMWHGVPLSDLDGTDFRKERTQLTAEFRTALLNCLRGELKYGSAGNCRLMLEDVLDRWSEDEDFVLSLCQAISRGEEPDAMRSWLAEVSGRHTLIAGRIVSELERTMQPGSAEKISYSSAYTPKIPRQLPANRTTLVGRESLLEEISTVLLAAAPAKSARIVVLRGLPGVGKTAAALHWAEKHQDEFPDGTVFADLQGFSNVPLADSEQVLSGFFEELGISRSGAPAGRLAEAFRTELVDRRVLFILDNARDVDHVRPLLPANGSCAVIITSRDRLTGLKIGAGAHTIDVDLLSEDASVELLKARVGAKHVKSNGFLLPQIAAFCGGLPLALNAIGGAIEDRQVGAVREVLDKLRSPKSRIAQLDLGSGASVPGAFAISLSLLSDATKDLLWRLALHPGPTISAEALAWLAKDQGENAIRSRMELESGHLLSEPVLSRYALHDLLRASVIRLADEELAMAEELVRSHIFDFLLHNAWACDGVLVPARSLPVGESDGVDVVAPKSMAESMKWLSAEYDTITAAIRQADELGLDHYVWLLPMALVTYQWRKSRYSDALRYLSLAFDAAKRVADPGSRAMVCRMIAGTQLRLKKHELAKGWMRQASAIVAEGDGIWGKGENLHGLGIVHSECGEWDEAINLISSAVAQFRDGGVAVSEAGALASLAEVYLRMADFTVARSYCDEARTVVMTTADRNGIAGITNLSGRIFMGSGDAPSALGEFAAAAAVYRDCEYERNEILTLLSMAEAAGSLGRREVIDAALTRASEAVSSMVDGAELAAKVAVARQCWEV